MKESSGKRGWTRHSFYVKNLLFSAEVRIFAKSKKYHYEKETLLISVVFSVLRANWFAYAGAGHDTLWGFEFEIPFHANSYRYHYH